MYYTVWKAPDDQYNMYEHQLQYQGRFFFFSPWITNKDLVLGLPGWSSGQESSCQGRGHGFQPWSRMVPHAREQLSPCTAATESAYYNYRSLCIQSLSSATKEAATKRNPHMPTKNTSYLPQLEKARTQQRRPSTIKNKFFKISSVVIDTSRV